MLSASATPTPRFFVFFLGFLKYFPQILLFPFSIILTYFPIFCHAHLLSSFSNSFLPHFFNHNSHLVPPFSIVLISFPTPQPTNLPIFYHSQISSHFPVRLVFPFSLMSHPRFLSPPDSELEIIEQEPRYRPEDINALCRTTHFTRPELQRLYRSFKDRCPTGVVREDAFKELYFQMFPKGG